MTWVIMEVTQQAIRPYSMWLLLPSNKNICQQTESTHTKTMGAKFPDLTRPRPPSHLEKWNKEEWGDPTVLWSRKTVILNSAVQIVAARNFHSLMFGQSGPSCLVIYPSLAIKMDSSQALADYCFSIFFLAGTISILHLVLCLLNRRGQENIELLLGLSKTTMMMLVILEWLKLLASTPSIYLLTTWIHYFLGSSSN